MRSTLNLNDGLIERARKLTRIKEKTALIHEALRVLIAIASQRELAAMAGVQKNLKKVPRRK